jgi:chromosomal replication initiation ATPase DnaA
MIQEKDYVKEAIELKIKLTRTKNQYEQKIASLEREIAKLKHEIKHPFKPLIVDLDLEKLMRIVCNHCDVHMSSVISKDRHRELTIARQLFGFIAVVHMRCTLMRVGTYLNRDHSTIISGNQRVRDALDMKFYPETELYEKCMSELRGMPSQGN